MFWDKVAKLYDLCEDLFNGKVNLELCREVEAMIDTTDDVLECACGTGMISRYIGEKCNRLIATDCSAAMLKQARKKCSGLSNVRFREADIMHLRYKDNAFDKVVAGNVIHLLDNPYGALKELERVCKKGGKIIIPTYILAENKVGESIAVRLMDKAGANFKRQFSYRTYMEFFSDAGYVDVKYSVIDGKMPCAIAVVTK